MSTVYRINGDRFVRTYKAPTVTPLSDLVSDSQCASDAVYGQAWTKAVAQAVAPASPGDAEAEKLNVANIQAFDAFEFCAEHDSSGRHRVYAGMACYRFRLPAAAVSSLASVSMPLSTDPYARAGLRIAVALSPSPRIPEDRSACRLGGLYDGSAAAPSLVPSSRAEASGQPVESGNAQWSCSYEGGTWAGSVAPRNIVTSGSSRTLYPRNGSVTFEVPSGWRSSGMDPGYLFIFVSLEDYAYTSGSYLRGSGHLAPYIEVTADDGLDVWTGGSEEPVDNDATGVFPGSDSDSVPFYGMFDARTGVLGRKLVEMVPGGAVKSANVLDEDLGSLGHVMVCSVVGDCREDYRPLLPVPYTDIQGLPWGCVISLDGGSSWHTFCRPELMENYPDVYHFNVKYPSPENSSVECEDRCPLVVVRPSGTDGIYSFVRASVPSAFPFMGYAVRYIFNALEVDSGQLESVDVSLEDVIREPSGDIVSGLIRDGLQRGTNFHYNRGAVGFSLLQSAVILRCTFLFRRSDRTLRQAAVLVTLSLGTPEESFAGGSPFAWRYCSLWRTRGRLSGDYRVVHLLPCEQHPGAGITVSDGVATLDFFNSGNPNCLNQVDVYSVADLFSFTAIESTGIFLLARAAGEFGPAIWLDDTTRVGDIYHRDFGLRDCRLVTDTFLASGHDVSVYQTEGGGALHLQFSRERGSALQTSPLVIPVTGGTATVSWASVDPRMTVFRGAGQEPAWSAYSLVRPAFPISARSYPAVSSRWQDVSGDALSSDPDSSYSLAQDRLETPLRVCLAGDFEKVDGIETGGFACIEFAQTEPGLSRRDGYRVVRAYPYRLDPGTREGLSFSVVTGEDTGTPAGILLTGRFTELNGVQVPSGAAFIRYPTAAENALYPPEDSDSDSQTVHDMDRLDFWQRVVVPLARVEGPLDHPVYRSLTASSAGPLPADVQSGWTDVSTGAPPARPVVHSDADPELWTCEESGSNSDTLYARSSDGAAALRLDFYRRPRPAASAAALSCPTELLIAVSGIRKSGTAQFSSGQLPSTSGRDARYSYMIAKMCDPGYSYFATFAFYFTPNLATGRVVKAHDYNSGLASYPGRLNGLGGITGSNMGIVDEAYTRSPATPSYALELFLGQLMEPDAEDVFTLAAKTTRLDSDIPWPFVLEYLAPEYWDQVPGHVADSGMNAAKLEELRDAFFAELEITDATLQDNFDYYGFSGRAHGKNNPYTVNQVLAFIRLQLFNVAGGRVETQNALVDNIASCLKSSAFRRFEIGDAIYELDRAVDYAGLREIARQQQAGLDPTDASSALWLRARLVGMTGSAASDDAADELAPVMTLVRSSAGDAAQLAAAADGVPRWGSVGSVLPTIDGYFCAFKSLRDE